VPRNGIADAKAGQVVAIELMEPPSMHSQPVGRVTEVLGEIDDPGMEIEIAVRKYEVPHLFSDAALAQAAALPSSVGTADRKGASTSPTSPWSPIDGEDARDFDDAVYCEPVRIGQVEGRQRLAPDRRDRRRQPLRPPRRADRPRRLRARDLGLFPAPRHPDAAREALEWPLLAQPRGRAPGDGLRHARRRRRRSAGVPVLPGGDPLRGALHLHRGGGDPRQHARSGSGARTALVPHLLDLHDVYRALLKARVKRGAIDFETTETQIVCDENGRIEKIVPRTRNEAHRLIEESMLAANVLLCRLHRPRQAPGALSRPRRADAGKEDAAAELPEGARPGPVDQRRPRSRPNTRRSRRRPRSGPTPAQIHQMLLRSMQQAIYTSKNIGHFGLAYEAYTHFTSPIRRYPDLLVHRVIKALLDSRRYAIGARAEGEPAKKARLAKAVKTAKNAKAGTSPLPPLAPGGELEAWEIAGAHCSANERRADEASRDVEAWLKCRYMREHLGEEFGGAVSAGDELRPIRPARRPLRRRAGPRHRARRRVLPLRRGSPGAARRAIGDPLRGRHARSSPGQPRRSRRPQDRFPPRREGEEATTSSLRTRREKAAERTEAATSEIVALKDADRVVKAVAKAKARARSGASSRPVRAGKTAVRKAASGRSGARGTPRR
jgi:ribonuclease R